MPRIIIVDDSEQDLYLLEVVLRTSGYLVVTARNGAEALQAGRTTPPDLIVSDILMPVMDGFTLCREWKKDPALGAIPFVFYTATYTDQRDEVFALQLGADRFITKPADPALLLESIADVLSRCQQLNSRIANPLTESNEDYFKTYSEVLSRKIGDNLELFRAIFYVDPSALLLLSVSNTIKEINWTAERLLGCSSEELRDKNFIECFVASPSRPLFSEQLATATSGTTIRGFECTMSPEHGPERTFLWNIQRIIRASGTIEGLLLIGSDITEKKAFDKERADIENQLHHARKMEAIGQLAGSIAHDFNNYLSVIIGYCDLILADMDKSNPFVESILHIAGCSERAAGLTRQLLAFSRKQVLAPKVLNLNHLITDLSILLRQLIGEHIELVIQPSKDLWFTKSDQAQLEQIIINLAVNARDAMPDGGTLTIETANVVFDNGTTERVPVPAPGRYVMVRITDHGTGMDAATKEHIFEPFFTTKEPGKGTGLGLATVYAILKQSRGAVVCDSTPGVGTTFAFYLPSVADPGIVDKPAAVSAASPRGTETILLAEDDPVIRHITSTMLLRSGYTVLAAANGEEALEMMHRKTSVVHLLLTDMVMPKLGGRVLYKKLYDLQPGLKVIYTSGYADDITISEGAAVDEIVFLPKPFTMETLLMKVRMVLEKK